MEQDSSGLYHTQSRYYSPTFGRFLSADAGFSPNLFAYVGDNPINAIDPTGEYAEAPPVCSGWCAVAEYAVAEIIVKSIATGNLLKGIEDFLQSVFDPGNIFGDWFGGGGSAPIIPPGYYRHAHYPASEFIGSPYAITPNMEDSFRREALFGGKIIWVKGQKRNRNLIAPIFGDLAKRGITGPRERPYWMKPPDGPAEVIPLSRFDPWSPPTSASIAASVGVVGGMTGLMILLTPTETGCQPGIETCAPGYRP